MVEIIVSVPILQSGVTKFKGNWRDNEKPAKQM